MDLEGLMVCDYILRGIAEETIKGREKERRQEEDGGRVRSMEVTHALLAQQSHAVVESSQLL